MGLLGKPGGEHVQCLIAADISGDDKHRQAEGGCRAAGEATDQSTVGQASFHCWNGRQRRLGRVLTLTSKEILFMEGIAG